ncbi:MAG: transcriptional regulator [Magnetospirillum sp.]|nr:transcriptional regulator [Magnetospirillum sp.]
MTTDNGKHGALARVKAAWGESMPDWVDALGRACDQASQSAVAKRIGYSAAAVSFVINAKYTGDLTAVEQAVRGALMAATVACPLVGELATDACLAHQRAAWAPHNPQRIAFYRACRSGCPHSRHQTGGNHARS